MRKIWVLLFVLLFWGVVLSCQKEFTCIWCETENKLPVAKAGVDAVITLPADSTLLDGSASLDPDGRIMEWLWSMVEGPADPAFRKIDSARTMATRLRQGEYIFELTVKDNRGATAKDSVRVSVKPSVPVPVTNRSPIACAGQDKQVTAPVSTVILSGLCSTDPDNNITAFQWTQLSGPSSANIGSSNGAEAQVTGLVIGIYLFQLKVTDAGGLFSLDTLKVTVNSAASSSNADVYVAGEESSRAKYWKNGQGVELSTKVNRNSWATDIVAVGNDIYVSGDEGDGFSYGENSAKYWKNGQEVYLTGETGAGTSSIAVDGGDVYVAGWEMNSAKKTVAKYWKNGQAVSLTNGSVDAVATGLVVSGGVVYVSGYEGDVAKYWKNGQPIALTNGSSQAFANCIAVVGNDVYVGGSELTGPVHVAKYWKNGQQVILSGAPDYTFVTGIAVAGSDVHVCGYAGDYGSYVAKYWKNGTAVNIPGLVGVSIARDVTVSGGDVYVAGYDNGMVNWMGKYWKNGQPFALTPANGSFALSIFVVQR